MSNNGELVVQKCPSCGATADLDENQNFGFCKYCGSKIIKKESIVQKVKVTNPIEIQGGVKIVNNEFEAKLAKIDHEAQKLLNCHGSKTEKAKEIIDSYKRLENIGGNEPKLWEHFLEFYVKINMEKNCNFIGIHEFEETIRDIYNQVLKYEKDENIIKSIKEKYDILKIISQYKEKYKKNNIKVFIMAIAFLIGMFVIVRMFTL